MREGDSGRGQKHVRMRRPKEVALQQPGAEDEAIDSYTWLRDNQGGLDGIDVDGQHSVLIIHPNAHILDGNLDAFRSSSSI